MNIQLGQYAGFCFGVDRAVSMVEEATKAGGTVVTLGPIIHNHHVVDRFQRMGVEVANSPEEVRPGSTVVLRAHGVPRQVEETLAGLPGPGGGCHLPLCQADSPPGSGGRGGGTDPRDHRYPHPPGGGGHCQLVPEGHGL